MHVCVGVYVSLLLRVCVSVWGQRGSMVAKQKGLHTHPFTGRGPLYTREHNKHWFPWLTLTPCWVNTPLDPLLSRDTRWSHTDTCISTRPSVSLSVCGWPLDWQRAQQAAPLQGSEHGASGASSHRALTSTWGHNTPVLWLTALGLHAVYCHGPQGKQQRDAGWMQPPVYQLSLLCLLLCGSLTLPVLSRIPIPRLLFPSYCDSLSLSCSPQLVYNVLHSFSSFY